MLGNPSKVDSFTLLWLVAKDLKFKGKKLGAYLNVYCVIGFETPVSTGLDHKTEKAK